MRKKTLFKEAPQEETPVEVTPAQEPNDPTIPAELTPETKPSAAAKETSSPVAAVPPYHERYYLRYREGKRSTELDLAGTRSFLQNCGFDGGELRQARKSKDYAETLRNPDKNSSSLMHCSYCGADISGVEYDRLPDGRVRCTACSKSLVTSKQDMESLCKRVLSNMENFFGATIDVPVSIEVMESRKLKRRLGMPLGVADAQSILILGVAINKRKKYSIILENGAPRISLIATFAHELTHIWQYTHWDNNKDKNKKFRQCSKAKRLLIYEGMAKWAEIQYLYLVGETAVARREEYITRKRNDPYGIGFCLYEDHYPLSREIMSCDDTPFTPDKYPFDP